MAFAPVRRPRLHSLTTSPPSISKCCAQTYIVGLDTGRTFHDSLAWLLSSLTAAS